MKPAKHGYVFALLMACLLQPGCRTKPYYTFEGQGESKKLIVHKKDGSEIVIDLGWGIGGGVWKFISKEELRKTKGPIVKTIEEQGVTFTLTYDRSGVIPVGVKDVQYDGKTLEVW
ncbi:MAG: hypothetical protein Tsb009_22640 [Planctomycetaceae bacterium]